MPEYNFFAFEDFNCPCCNANITSPTLIGLLDTARDFAGIPFVITSGTRCKAHNKKVGGSVTSSHLQGLAADISAPTSSQKFKIIHALMQVGFTRIGVSSDMVHVDIDSSKVQDVVWTY